MPQMTKAGLEIIKRNEGCRLTAYRDVVNVLTIGWGHTGPEVRDGLTITQAQADAWLASRLANEFEPGVLKALAGAPVTDNQFSAMTSLAYNIGVGGFAGSTLARQHRAGNYQAAADAFLSWNKAGGQVLAGLDRRRGEERALYLTPDAAPEGMVMTTTPSPRLSPNDALDRIQEALRDAGLYTGPIDHDFGKGSRAALNALLRAAGQALM